MNYRDEIGESERDLAEAMKVCLGYVNKVKSSLLCFKLRDKESNKFLTQGHIDDLEENDMMWDKVLAFNEEQQAHNIRFEYEKRMAEMGLYFEIEVVAISVDGQEIEIS